MKDGNCIAMTQLTKLQVKALRVGEGTSANAKGGPSEQNAATFFDMMISCSNDEGRKEKIVDLYTNQPELLKDSKFNFDISKIAYYLENDTDFFFQIIKASGDAMIYLQEVYARMNSHYASILKEDKFKQSR